MDYRRSGETAPDVEVVDPGTGADRTLEDLLGARPTLLFWIKTSCPTCRLSMPFVERIAKRVGPGRVAVVAQNGPDEVAAYREDLGLAAAAIYCEPEPWSSADRYGLTHVPTWFLVAPDRRVLASGTMFSQADLQSSYAALGGEGDLLSPAEQSEYPETRPG